MTAIRHKGLLDDILGKREPAIEDVIEQCSRVFGTHCHFRLQGYIPFDNDDEPELVYDYVKCLDKSGDARLRFRGRNAVRDAYAALFALPDLEDEG